MPECEHLNVNIQNVHFTLPDGAGDGINAHSLHTRAWCKDCGTPFRFAGSFPTAPTDATEALAKGVGAWVSTHSEELAVMIEPVNNPGAGLIGLAPSGRA